MSSLPTRSGARRGPALLIGLLSRLPLPVLYGLSDLLFVLLFRLLRFQRGLAVDNERTDLHNLKGFCHFQLKEHEEAIRAFKNVIRLNPASAIDYANVASNYRDLDRHEDAIRYYRMALEIDPSIEFARDNLARLTGNPPAS